MNKQNLSPMKGAEATVDGVPADAVVMYGSAVKAAGIVDGIGYIEGYGVVFDTSGNPEQRDLSGQYFSSKTYLGPTNGDGADGTFHHMLSIKGMPTEFADHLFAPIKTTRQDNVGLFVRMAMDMANDYERAVYGLAAKGKLGFSSGTAAHMMKVADDGEILRWPIIEMALTPTPCEPRARATAMKALEAETGSEAMKAFVEEFKAALDEPAEAQSNGDAEKEKEEALKAIRRDALLLQADLLRLKVALA